ncbi:hypothetical protein WMY93_024848 [Mugilogobius chulae]|uniref:Fibronectin type-III domain-containing protein n=1 Tax=Mugilogobius chulae TaxID=88201 RepID=A0AAW0N431_9GOBI
MSSLSSCPPVLSKTTLSPLFPAPVIPPSWQIGHINTDQMHMRSTEVCPGSLCADRQRERERSSPLGGGLFAERESVDLLRGAEADTERKRKRREGREEVKCLQPCKELWETRKVLSPKSCEKHTECVTSREFIVSLRTSRQGDCPAPQKATGFAAACVPANLYKGVPLKPRREMSFVEDLEGRVRVLWLSKFNVSVEPVVYVLQSRWNPGIHPSEDHASPWTTVTMTLSEDVLLSDLRSQRWYQFRVAAVNSQGSRGFTTPSKHYISNRDPSPPEAPQNIRVDNQTVQWSASPARSQFTESRGSVATVTVLLRWDVPEKETCLCTTTESQEQSRRDTNTRVTQGLGQTAQIDSVTVNEMSVKYGRLMQNSSSEQRCVLLDF